VGSPAITLCRACIEISAMLDRHLSVARALEEADWTLWRGPAAFRDMAGDRVHLRARARREGRHRYPMVYPIGVLTERHPKSGTPPTDF
jgi:hypothetical protein